MSVLNKAKEKFESIIEENDLKLENIEITAAGLSPEEAIGDPDRQDFPLLQGEEVMIEACFNGYRGQAFTDHPGEFSGTLEEILQLDLENNYHRALFVASVNAVLRSLNLVEKTVHCRDNEMEECVKEMVDWIKEKYPETNTLGIIGFQPALLEAAAARFSAENIIVTDLNRDRIGKKEYGIKVLDGESENEFLISESDFVLSTGSTMVNDTASELLKMFDKYDTSFAFYGNTVTGLAFLLDLPQLCFHGRSG